MYEQVEVHTNPRSRHRRRGHDDQVDVHLTKAEIRRALTTKPRRKKSAAAAAPKKKKRKKRRKGGYGRNPKTVIPQLIIGAAITAAIEIYVFRNPQWEKQIPPQVRKFSGLIMAVLGFAVTMLKGRGMAMVRPVGQGIVASGVFMQLKEVLVQMRKDAVISEGAKILAEAVEAVTDEEETGTDGLGRFVHRLPRPSNVSARDAAIMLGMQSRVPYHPHGMGELVQLDGLGSFVDVAGGIQDRSMDARLLSPGLGEMVVSDTDQWLDGQFAYRDEFHESW